jgi:hypothetical protein
MKKVSKVKIILEAIVVIAVALALVVPSSAVITNTASGENTISAMDGKNKVDIREVKTWDKTNPCPLGDGEVIQITGWWPGDDRRPAICEDSQDHVFITWENDEDVTTSGAGFAWNHEDDVFDQEAWWNNGVIIALVGLEEIIYPDTALCEHPDYELMGAFLGLDVEQAGGYYIPDVTDYTLWEFYTWEGAAAEPEYAQIADGGWWQDLNYPEVVGPFNFYIYHEIYQSYDIPSCPICFHTGIDSGKGVGYFDGQSEELTAPASDPDMVNFEDRFHTVVQYTNDTTGEHIVWKKIIPSEEPDYEFTPYQATIADGMNPAIAGFDDGTIAIVYAYDGAVECIYSDDDGDSWTTSTVAASGCYPDIYAWVDAANPRAFYCTYIDGGNLYLVTSDDGGATWSTPTQINDEDGTVVEEENSVDVHHGGIVWVDDRGDDYDIYFYQLFEPIPEPEIEVEITSGFGLGVKGVVRNTGEAVATDVTGTLTVLGGILGRIDIALNISEESLDVGGEIPVNTGLFFGLGAIEIVLEAECTEGKKDKATGDGVQLIIFTKVN